MKLVIALAVLVAVVASAPLDDNQVARVLRYENNVNEAGYEFLYETSDGVKRQEEGHLDNVGAEKEVLVVTGSYSFVAPDGQNYTVTYVADENGYKPQGTHLPSSQ